MRNKMRNKMFVLVLLTMFFAGAVPSFAASGERPQNAEAFSDIPPDTSEYFVQRYKHFLGLKKDKPLQQLAEQLNKFAQERDKWESKQTKLNRGILDLREKFEKARDDKNRRRIEKNIAKKNQELAKIQIRLDPLVSKIATLKEQVDPLIEKFWLERDTDPTTPENEEKQRIDQLIDNITDEPFFGALGTIGLLFRTNGGFWGDMAHVYLLHGEPDVMDTIEGHSFVPLMLWIYLDPADGDILYAFLFYQKSGGGGSFKLFSQDLYQIDQCGALYEVATLRTYNYSLVGRGRQNCPEDLYQVYDEIWRSSGKGGILDGTIFAWSLFNFSMDPGLKLGKALEPPKPASEIARQSKARIVGEAPKLIGTAGTDYILASCEKCNSFIPAELRLGKEFVLKVRRGDIDWRIVGNRSESVLKIRLVIESILGQGQVPLIFEKWATLKSPKNLIVSDPAGQRIIPLLTSDEVAGISAGTYRVSIYVKNVTPDLMTKKYNAWSKEITITK